MNATSVVSSASTSSIAQSASLNRVLREELQEIRRTIGWARTQDPRFYDRMTSRIEEWVDWFLGELKTCINEEKLLEYYIEELQARLVDPTSFAPLGLYALLGSDGYTYDPLSWEIYRLTAPSEEIDRSPMNPADPTLCQMSEHTVVRCVAKWLQKRGALQYSEELIRQYIELLPTPEEPLDLDERVRQIVAEQVQRDRMEADLQDQQIGGLEQRIQQQLGLMQQQAGVDRARLEVQIEQIGQPFQAVELKLREAKEAEQKFSEEIRGLIQEKLTNKFEAIAQRVDAFANGAHSQVDGIEARNRKAMEQCKAAIEQLNQERHQLEKGLQQLKTSQQGLAGQLDAAKKEEMILQQRIIQTQIAINELKKKRTQGVFEAVAMVGVSLFATWAVGALLAKTGFSVGIAATPGKSGGVMASIRYMG